MGSATSATLRSMGIHLGDVLLRGHEVHGAGVNIAARLLPLSEGGGICISDEVQHAIENQDNVATRSLGGPRRLEKRRAACARGVPGRGIGSESDSWVLDTRWPSLSRSPTTGSRKPVPLVGLAEPSPRSPAGALGSGCV
jgi:hypothetical protein